MHDAIILPNGDAMIDSETNGQVREESIPAAFACILTEHMHTGNDEALGHWIHRSTPWTGELVPEFGLDGDQVLVHDDQVARWKRQKVSMPFTMRMRFSRMRGKRRSTRNMCTMKEMMVAQIAPMEPY